jgi:hypothetical protein
MAAVLGVVIAESPPDDMTSMGSSVGAYMVQREDIFEEVTETNLRMPYTFSDVSLLVVSKYNLRMPYTFSNITF